MENLDFSARIRNGEDLCFKDRLSVVYHLSLPGILAQISEIVMQYIDAAMVGVLGAGASASIGLVSSSTWLFGGAIAACADSARDILNDLLSRKDITLIMISHGTEQSVLDRFTKVIQL